MLARPFRDLGNGLSAAATDHYPHDEGPAALDLVKRNPWIWASEKAKRAVSSSVVKASPPHAAC